MTRSGARRLLGMAGGIGSLPAPGTAASAATAAAALLLCGFGAHAGALAPGAQLPVLAAVVALVTVVGVLAGQRATEDFGVSDPGAFVLDEVVGQLLALLPLLPGPLSLPGVALAFALFRLLDIWKPWPVRRLEALPGGLGIMADDFLAGAVAAAGTAAAQSAGWLG